MFHSGFACLAGRPNAGKSTLTNALVGSKVAITSSWPQTTRHAIRGLLNRPEAQLVLVDTPGLHRPRTVYGERLNDLVRSTWAEVDSIGLCVPADQRIGPGDRNLMRELAQLSGTPVLAVLTKIDAVSRGLLAERLQETQRAGLDEGLDFRDIVPVSAMAGEQVDVLADTLTETLPEGPELYPGGQLSDEPEETLVAEFVREAALERVRDELPHSIAVTVEEMVPRDERPDDNPLVDVRVNLFIERESQKPIIIGRSGEGLRRIGERARKQIEALLGTPVYLDVRVKVAKDWQRDPKQLRRLGL